MSDAPDIFSYVFIWQAFPGACRKCQALNGREYRGQDLFQPVLEDPQYGPIWDLQSNHSLAHGLQQYNCRCMLLVKVSVNLGEWQPYQELQEMLRTL